MGDVSFSACLTWLPGLMPCGQRVPGGELIAADGHETVGAVNVRLTAVPEFGARATQFGLSDDGELSGSHGFFSPGGRLLPTGAWTIAKMQQKPRNGLTPDSASIRRRPAA